MPTTAAAALQHSELRTLTASYPRTYRTSCRCRSAPVWKCRTRCTTQFRSSSAPTSGVWSKLHFALLGRREPALGLSGFQRGRGASMAEEGVGPEEGDRGEVAKSAVQSYASGVGRRLIGLFWRPALKQLGAFLVHADEFDQVFDSEVCEAWMPSSPTP